MMSEGGILGAADDRRIEFKTAFKRFSKLMDVVLPDPIATQYREDLKQLSTIYGKAKERYRDKTMNLKGARAKVQKLIQDHICPVERKTASGWGRFFTVSQRQRRALRVRRCSSCHYRRLPKDQKYDILPHWALSS
jgi:hypothetical protein